MPDPARPSILVVDDSRELRLIARSALDRSGRFEVVAEAANGAEAVQLAGQLAPDVVLLDLMMPVMDGLTALPLLTRASPHSMIAVWTALSDHEAELIATARGAFTFLLKGTDLADLIDVLEERLDVYRRGLAGETVFADRQLRPFAGV